MGKSNHQHQHQHHHQIDIPDVTDADPHPHCAARIGGAVSLRCAVVLLLSVSVLLSAIFCLPLFRARLSGFLSDDADALAADIQANFILEKPISLLVSHIGRLEYDILEEIGVPNTKVSIISMHSLAEANTTNVVFAVLPNPKDASISIPALSVLRSSLVELVLQQLNLSLTPSIFGQPSTFEVLKFPGGITVVPAQSASIWEITQILFNFTLNSSIAEIQKDLEELKAQLKLGLNLRSYENVYVQMTNANGSTMSPPVIVQASVLSDYGNRHLLPDRLKQLAQVIKGSHAENFGLNHTVFGKVKAVQLSSYLQHSIASPSASPSPSPSLSPSKEAPSSAPSPSDPTSPSYAPVPSTDNPQPPCVYCDAVPPTDSPLSYAPEPETGPIPPSQSFISPSPSIPNIVSPPRRSPCISSSVPPRASPIVHPHPSTPTYNAPNTVIPPQYKPPSPTPQMAPPESSPSSPAMIYGSSPPKEKGNGKNPMPPISASPDVSPSPISHSASNYADTWPIALLMGSVMLHLIFLAEMNMSDL